MILYDAYWQTLNITAGSKGASSSEAMPVKVPGNYVEMAS